MEAQGLAAVAFVQATTQLDSMLVCSDAKLGCAKASSVPSIAAVACGNPV